MKQIPLSVAACALATLLSACGGDDGDNTTTTLAKSIESIQCVTVPETIEELDAALARANITPTAKSCAWDGLDRTFSCGSTAAYLRVIEIPNSQSSAANALGYKSLTAFSKVVPIPCAQ